MDFLQEKGPAVLIILFFLSKTPVNAVIIAMSAIIGFLSASGSISSSTAVPVSCRSDSILPVFRGLSIDIFGPMRYT